MCLHSAHWPSDVYACVRACHLSEYRLAEHFCLHICLAADACLRVPATGSDDGRVFIYDAKTGAAIIALQADEDVANCVAPHPSLPVLATSGIESAIRLWAPHGPAAWHDLRAEIASNQVVLRGPVHLAVQGCTQAAARLFARKGDSHCFWDCEGMLRANCYSD